MNQSRYVKSALSFIFVVLSFGMLLSFVSAVEPTGGTTSVIGTSTNPADTAGNNSAIAGNITEMNINGYVTTQSWQGYFGNVTGTIELADSANNVFYNWSLAEPAGEVYASMNSSIQWTNVQCFNFTANGNLSNNMTGETAGSTNLFGLNVSQVESQFGIISDDLDGVNETFSLLGAGTHDAFFTASRAFSEGECRSSRIFGDTGQGVADEFEEVLMYEAMSRSLIYTAILEEGAQLGYNAQDHDFEMMVLENGHGTDVSVTSYYFFVELE